MVLRYWSEKTQLQAHFLCQPARMMRWGKATKSSYQQIKENARRSLNQLVGGWQDTLAAPLSPGPTHRRLAELPGNGQPTRALSSNIVLLEETLPPGTREKQDTATREVYLPRCDTTLANFMLVLGLGFYQGVLYPRPTWSGWRDLPFSCSSHFSSHCHCVIEYLSQP